MLLAGAGSDKVGSTWPKGAIVALELRNAQRVEQEAF
ncbi:MAG: hypothetical protein KatS3mg107_0668 [Gemmataceae bacterium]|jgi:hypothetical protein|nr:MAG: hypothetical protein KatS3mg107_0668 [Gemmataceae bacterium]